MEVRIIFNDGTSVVAEQNANTYITAAQPVFPDDLSVVTVESDNQAQVFRNVTIQECASVDGRYWFGLLEETEQARVIRELRETNDMLTECILEMSEIIYG